MYEAVVKLFLTFMLQVNHFQTHAEHDCLGWKKTSICLKESEENSMAKFIGKLVDELHWRNLVLHIDNSSDEVVNDFLIEQTTRRYQILMWTNRGHFNFRDIGGGRTDDNIEPIYNHLVICKPNCVTRILRTVSTCGSSKFLQFSRWFVVTENLDVHRQIGSLGELENIAIMMSDRGLRYIVSCTNHSDVDSHLDMYTLRRQGDITRFQLLKEWRYSDGQPRQNMTRIMFPNTQNGLNGRTLRVGVGEWAPFIMKTTEPGETMYKGLTIDLFDELARQLNFRYTLVDDPNDDWGELKNGSWTGLINMLINNDIDIIGVPYAPQEERLKVMDFSYPVIVSTNKAYYKKPSKTESRWRLVLDIFHWTVLVIMMGCLLAVSLYLSVLEMYSPQIINTKSSPLSCHDVWKLTTVNFWKLFGNMLNQGSSLHTVNSSRKGSMSFRAVFAAWCLFCLLITVTYAAHLVPGLGVVRQRVPFNSLQGLVGQDEYKWGTISGSFLVLIFQTSRTPLYQQMWRGMMEFSQTDTDVLSVSESTQLKKLEAGGYVYFESSYHMAEILANTCDIGSIKEPVITTPSSLLLSKNSPYTQIFSQQILRFIEDGMMKDWEKKWMSQKKRCSKSKTEARAVDLLTVQSVFYLLSFGICLSLVTFVGETVRSKLCFSAEKL